MLLLQTPFAKKQIRQALIAKAEDYGVKLSIQSISGSLPFDWKGKNIELGFEDENISIDSIQMRLSFFSLFKKHLKATHIKIHGGSFRETSFEGVAKGRIDLKGKKPAKISQFLLEGDDLFVHLEGKILSDWTFEEGSMTFRLPNAKIISPLFTKGALLGSGTVTDGTIHFQCIGENLFIKNHPLEKTTFIIDGVQKKDDWEGKISFLGGPKSIHLSGEADYRFSPSCKLISIEDFKLDGPDLRLFGKMDLDPRFTCLEGTIFGKAPDLRSLRPLFPNTDLAGRLGVKIDFQSFSEFQDLKWQLEGENIEFGNNTCESLSIETTLYDLFGDLRGEFAIEASTLTAPTLKLDTLEVHSVFEPSSSPFSIKARGNYEGPLEVFGSGNWKKKDGGVFAKLESLKGTALQKAISLSESCTFLCSPKALKVHNLSLDIGEGHLFSRVDLSKKTSLIKIKGENFPLEFIPLPSKYCSLAGKSNFDIDLLSWDKKLEGSCNIALERAHFYTEGTNDWVTTKGSLQVHFSQNIAQVHGEIKARNSQFLHLSGTLPIHYEHLPFKITLDEENPFSAQILAEGNIEELLNFINVGHQRIEGFLSTNLHLSKTLSKPMLQGDFQLQNALYENYFSGTKLQEISAKGYYNRQNIVISDLYGVDGQGGSLSATGNVLLNPHRKFPFTLTANLHQLEAVTFDTISGNFSGQVTISGDNTGAIARGKLKVDEATFRIPDELPSVLPELPIRFINTPESLTRKKNLSPASSPLRLDLDLDVPRKAYVVGRGLTSELQGKLHLSGNFVDISAQGNLQLIHGEYLFSGKVFDLTQGEIIFNDKPTPSAYLSLSGDCDLPDVNVTVMLRGPLSSPNLSFKSSPQLPTSSLLSQILFNKDISEISAVQALQLAQTVISLSGNSGPDILEKIRKTLGIDRLTLVTSENDPGKISLQIGKYLMRGILLTLSQGAESRNVSVEVDLKKGVRLQAEMNEDQQGKFSLKWHHHY